MSNAEVARPFASASERLLGGGFELRGLVQVFQRRFRLFLTAVALILIATLAATFIIPPKFTAQSTVKIDPQQHVSLDTARDNSQLPDSALVDTEASVIKSRAVLTDVVNRLGLVRDKEFGPKANDDEGAATAADRSVDRLLKALNVDREGTNYLIDVKVTSKDAVKSAAIANAVVKAYLDFSERSRESAAEEQTHLLNQRLGQLGSEVEGEDARVAQYRAQVGIVSGAGNNGTVTDQQISTIASQLAEAQARAAEATSKAQAAEHQVQSGNIEAVSEVLGSPVITDLRRQRTEIVRQQAEMSARYGPRHPDYIRVTEQLHQLDQQISAEAQRIYKGLESDARAAQAQAGSLAGNLARLKGQQSANAQATVQADSMQRVADAKRTIYNEMNRTAQETAQMAQLGDLQARVVAWASPPTRASFPNKPLFAALSIVIGAVVGVAGAFTAEALDSGIRTVEDVEQGLGVPFLASLKRIPSSQLRQLGPRGRIWDYVVKKPMSSFAEAFRSIRSVILLAKDGETGGKVILITSALPSEGKTVSAVSLARVMAMSGDRTILIDCDLRRNSLRDLLPSPPTAGLVEVLAGRAQLGDAVVADTVDGLDVLPLSGEQFTPKDLFSGPALTKLLEFFRSRYDFVILDAPPVLAVADTSALAIASDYAILMMRWATTSRYAAETALSRISATGVKVLGGATTIVDDRGLGELGERNPSYYDKMYRKYYQD